MINITFLSISSAFLPYGEAPLFFNSSLNLTTRQVEYIVTTMKTDELMNSLIRHTVFINAFWQITNTQCPIPKNFQLSFPLGKYVKILITQSTVCLTSNTIDSFFKQCVGFTRNVINWQLSKNLFFSWNSTH